MPAHGGDIRQRDLVKLAEADAEEQGGHAFRIMDAYVKSFESEGEKGRCALALMRLLGLFDRPAAADCLQALWSGKAIAGLTDPLVGLGEAQRNLTLQRLEDTNCSSSSAMNPRACWWPSTRIRCCGNTSRDNCARKIPKPGARPTDGSTNTFAQPHQNARSSNVEISLLHFRLTFGSLSAATKMHLNPVNPHWMTFNRFTKPLPTVAKPDSNRKRLMRFTTAEFCAKKNSTVRRSSVLSVRT